VKGYYHFKPKKLLLGEINMEHKDKSIRTCILTTRLNGAMFQNVLSKHWNDFKDDAKENWVFIRNDTT